MDDFDRFNILADDVEFQLRTDEQHRFVHEMNEAIDNVEQWVNNLDNDINMKAVGWLHDSLLTLLPQPKHHLAKVITSQVKIDLSKAPPGLDHTIKANIERYALILLRTMEHVEHQLGIEFDENMIVNSHWFSSSTFVY